MPHSGALSLAIGPIARLDVPQVLAQLDRYPYGCSEQISSRALPLLYLNEVAKMLGMGTDEALRQRVDDAIKNLLSKQNSSGGFGLWGPFDGSDLWLDAYITDFLLRAKDEGHAIPEEAMTRALDNLSNQVSYAADFSSGGEGIAYALHDLARAGRAAIGDLRYYAEAKLEAFSTPLAKAQLGAALALYGDRARAGTAFAAAVAALKPEEKRDAYRPDYGSRLRDTAAVLALAAEFSPAGVDIAALAERLAELRDRERYTSTQEDAWTLLAAAALARQADSGSVTIDGEALSGSVYRQYDQEIFDGGEVTVTNTGNQPTEMKVSVTGIPAEPPEAADEGFGITRDYYLPDGTPTDLERDRAERPVRRGADDAAEQARIGPVRGVRSAAGRVRDREPGPLGGLGRRRSQLAQRQHAEPCGVADRPVCRGVPLLLGGRELCDGLHGARRVAGQLRAAGRDGRGHVPAGTARQHGCGRHRGDRHRAVSRRQAARCASSPPASSCWRGSGRRAGFHARAVIGEIRAGLPATPELATLPVSTAVVDRNGQAAAAVHHGGRPLAAAGDAGRGRPALHRDAAGL